MTRDSDSEKTREGSSAMTRRALLRSVGMGALATGLAPLGGQEAAAQVAAQQLSWAETGPSPYAGVRVFEKSATLTCVYRKPKPERSGDEVRQGLRVN